MQDGKNRSHGWTALYWSVAALRVVLRLCGVAVLVGMVCPSVEAQTAHYAGYAAVVQTGTTLSSPFAVYVDSTETYAYVADMANRRVIRVAISGGAVTTVNLYNSGTNANCANPVGVVADASGNVYFTCTDTTTIYKATYSSGSYTLSTFYSGVAAGRGPRGMAIDSSGNLYIAVQYNGTGNQAYILKCSTSGSCSTFYTFAANTSGTSYAPQALAVDTSGNLYITDISSAAEVYKLSGSTLTAIQSCPSQGVSYAGGCYGVAVDTSGDVYMGSNAPFVYKLTPNGSGYTASTVYTAPGLLYRAVGIALNASGTTLYAADYTDGGQNLGNGLSGPNPASTNLIKFGAAGQGFGSVAVGTSSSSTLPLTFNFDTAGTLSSIAVLTGGQTGLDFTNAGTGTCNTTQSFSTSCTVNVTFTPTRVGLRTGAVVLKNSAGAVISTVYVSGTGVGPLVNFSSPTVVTVDSSLSGAEGLAGDANGNLYVAAGGTHIYKETLAAGSYTRSQLSFTTSSLSGAQWVTVDAAGDLFVPNASGTTILKETPSGSGYTETTAASVNGPNEVAMDSAGNLYTASGNAGGVYKFTLQSNGSYVQSEIASSSNNPWGVAVDGAGDVFYVAANTGYLYKLTPVGNSYTQGTLDTTLSNPTGLAIDSNGNLYVANDASSGPITKYTYNASNTNCSTSLASCYTKSSLTTGVTNPVGIWVDANDNVYIGDTGNNRVLKLDYADGPTVVLPTTAVGSTSAATTVTVANVGTAALLFSVPTSGTNPAVSANFGWTSTGGSACPALTTGSGSAGTLAAGSTCSLPVYFAPVSGTSDSGTLVLADNSGSGTTQTVHMTGTATYMAPTITSLSVTSGPAAGGTTVVISGTNLLGATGVTFGSGSAVVTGDTMTSLTVTTPVGSAGAVNVSVTTPGGTATRNGAFTYVAQTLTSLTVTGYSSPAITTEGSTVTVTALDQYGAVLPGFTGTVTLTSSDSAATLPSAYAFRGSDAGVHTFSVTLKTLGTESITATSGGVTGSQTGVMVDDAMWVESVNGTLSKLNALGAGVMTGVGTSNGAGLWGGSAMDHAGDVWSVSTGVSSLQFANAMGSGTSSATGGGLNAPVAVAVDGAGMVWVANAGGNSVSEFTSAGAAVSPASGFGSSYPVGDRMHGPSSMAIDGAGGVWVANRAASSVTHIFGAASPVVTPVAKATTTGTLGVMP